MALMYIKENRMHKRRRDDELLHKAVNDLLEAVRFEEEHSASDGTKGRLALALERFANRRNGG